MGCSAMASQNQAATMMNRVDLPCAAGTREVASDCKCEMRI